MFALGLIGVDYRYGGETPEGGLDCSGLVRHVFQQVTGVTLPRTSKELSRIGAPIGRGDLEAGDLVFFDTRRFAFSHVGIYLGDGRFVHAPSRGSEVEIAELANGYWRKHFNGRAGWSACCPAWIRSPGGAACDHSRGAGLLSRRRRVSRARPFEPLDHRLSFPRFAQSSADAPSRWVADALRARDQQHRRRVAILAYRHHQRRRPPGDVA
jgi:hypothetical protein